MANIEILSSEVGDNKIHKFYKDAAGLKSTATLLNVSLGSNDDTKTFCKIGTFFQNFSGRTFSLKMATVYISTLHNNIYSRCVSLVRHM